MNLFFGGLALIGTIMTLALVIPPQAQVALTNPVVEMIQRNPNYALFTRVSAAVGLVACVVLILAGLGLLLLRPWGRYLSIGYAAYAILGAIVGLAVNWYFLVPLVQKAIHMPAGPQQAAMIGGVVGGMAGSSPGYITR